MINTIGVISGISRNKKDITTITIKTRDITQKQMNQIVLSMVTPKTTPKVRMYIDGCT